MPVAVSLSFSSLNLCELILQGDTDFRGKPRPATERLFEACAALSVPDQRLPIPVRIQMNISKKLMPDTLARDVAETLACEAIRSHIASEWPTRRDIRLVGGESFHAQMAPATPSTPPSMGQTVKIEFTMVESCVTDLAAKWEALQAANRTYLVAVEQLRLIIQDGMYAVQQQTQRINALLDFITANLHAADLDSMSSWYDEKMPRVRTAIDELRRRKQSSHPEVKRYIDDATRQLCCFRSFDHWSVQPPSATTIARYLPGNISGAATTA